jgi:hypothetical protein
VEEEELVVLVRRLQEEQVGVELVVFNLQQLHQQQV